MYSEMTALGWILKASKWWDKEIWNSIRGQILLLFWVNVLQFLVNAAQLCNKQILGRALKIFSCLYDTTVDALSAGLC